MQKVSMKERALHYANLGIPVFPLIKGAKIPYGGSGGFKDATTDEKKINKMWDKDLNSNIGARTGKGSKIFVLDIDKKKDKNGFLWLKTQPELPNTLRMITPSGGEQAFFLMPDEPIASNADKLAEGIDIRADDGYTVLPPSYLKKTLKYEYEGFYEWITDQGIKTDGSLEIDITSIPKFLIEGLRELNFNKINAPIVNNKTPLSMEDIIAKYNLNLQHSKNGVYSGANPIHGSSNGKNFFIDTIKNLFHCFRCSSGGGAISLVAMLEGIVDCTECLPKGLTGNKFKKTLKIIEEKFNISLEKFNTIKIEDVIETIKKAKEIIDSWERIAAITKIGEDSYKLNKAERNQMVAYAKVELKLNREEMIIVRISGVEKKSSISLETYESGKPKHTHKNLIILFEEDPELKNSFRKNLFSEEIDILKTGQWNTLNNRPPRTISAIDIINIRDYILNTYDIEYSKNAIFEGIEARAVKKSYDPLLDYLDSLKWDQKPRLETWMNVYLKVEDSAYSRYISKLMLVSAIKRAYDPGCQYDCVVVLSGGQGLFKSSIIEVLGDPWFLNLTLNDKDKDTIQKMKGSWFLEFAEGTPFRKKEINEFKNFITVRAEKARFAYERVMETHKRRSVFIMTLNPESIGYLSDETGNRRFLPIRINKKPDIEGIRKIKDQLFAEAIHEYKNGFKIFIEDDNEEVNEGLNKEHSIAEVVDDWEENILLWLYEGKRNRSPENSEVMDKMQNLKIPDFITVGFIWTDCFLRDIAYYEPAKQGRRIGRILTKLVGEPSRPRVHGVQTKGYYVGAFIKKLQGYTAVKTND